jgi:putative heme-binding domain-containing protein
MLLAFAWNARAQTPGTNFFLPKNPVAAAYVLGRLSNAELVAAPRSEFVYVALLQRAGLERKYRVEALEGLSQIRHTARGPELLAAIIELDKKGESSMPILGELAPLLMQLGSEELRSIRERLVAVATGSQLALTRQLAIAACIEANGSLDHAWDQFKSPSAQFVDLVLSLPLVQTPSLRTAAYSKIEPLLENGEDPALQRAAIQAIVAVPGHAPEVFTALAHFVQARTQTDSAIAALLRIPQTAWSREPAPALASNLLRYIEGIPAAEQTSAPFGNALQLATDLASLLPEPDRIRFQQRLRGLGPTVVVLHAVYEQMLFDKQRIVVGAGKTVSIALQNDDAMPHNLAILSPGALEEIGQAAEKMPAEPDAQGRLYIPSSPKVLFATRMVPPGQRDGLAFVAPVEVGEYPFVCTFPGHWRRMSGVLVVVNDVEAYLASHPEVPTKITEWKLADLTDDLSLGKQTKGDPVAGKDLFSKLACVQCHKLGQVGYPYGPDLAEVWTRYKGDRTLILQQILEPSKTIDDRYRNFHFEVKGEEPVTGVVIREDAETITVQTGPANSLIQQLKKSDILERRAQASSPMPIGLLNTLSKEQILDLLAFLEAGGVVASHTHSH